MKSLLATSLLLGLLAPAAFAQYGQAIKRAKETANQNNVRQGVPAPAQNQPRPAAPGPARPGGSNVVTSVTKIQMDLAGFKTGPSATAEQKQKFTLNLISAARGPKPAATTVNKFVASLTTALPSATLTTAQHARLAQNIEAVLNGKAFPATQFDKIIDDVQAILEVGTVKRATAISVAADLKAIGTEVRR